MREWSQHTSGPELGLWQNLSDCHGDPSRYPASTKSWSWLVNMGSGTNVRSGDQLYSSQDPLRLPESRWWMPPFEGTLLRWFICIRCWMRARWSWITSWAYRARIFLRGLQTWLGQVHSPHLSADPPLPLPYQGPQTGGEYLVLYCPPGLPEAHLQLLPLHSIQGGLMKRKYAKKGQGGAGAGND